MLTDYQGWTIDATPDSFFGKYFARARIVQAFSDEHEEPQMHIERDIAWFDRRDDAVDCGVRWAVAWIDAHSECADKIRPASENRPMRQSDALMEDGMTSARG